MTYEPGQQVLVRGVMAAADFQLGQGPDHRYLHFSDNSGCRVPAADIVGPAPATPDMYEIAYWAVEKVLDEALGTEEEDGSGGGIAAEVYLLVEQRNQARAALAAAEAERDAYADALAKVTHEFRQVIADEILQRADPDVCPPFYNEEQYAAYRAGVLIAERIVRRALSVEAAGTEGGGE